MKSKSTGLPAKVIFLGVWWFVGLTLLISNFVLSLAGQAIDPTAYFYTAFFILMAVLLGYPNQKVRVVGAALLTLTAFASGVYSLLVVILTLITQKPSDGFSLFLLLGVLCICAIGHLRLLNEEHD